MLLEAVFVDKGNDASMQYFSAEPAIPIARETYGR
ncbi:hypothetical protein SAMN04489724_2570 [Algoriphagus locisalis]|uniref:Uncharacterized protein n=1 Tax=Algoriphagus locisalis TaxID=305507 RepID=A0A1I7BNL8_9BACT|nr:hypothetical protein SAMN04489724_2570 [Algoriphagus locisalis]